MTATSTSTSTVPALVLQRAATDPDRTALRRKTRGIWRSWTWSELAADVRDLAAGWWDDPPARLGVLAPPSGPVWALGLAAQAVGGAVVPLPLRGDPAELARRLAAASVDTVVVADHEQYDRLLDAVGPAGVRVLTLGTADLGPGATVDGLGTAGKAALAADPGLVDRAVAGLDPAGVGAVHFSGGMRGTPRAVPLPHAQLVAVAERLGEVLAPAAGRALVVDAEADDPTACHLLGGCLALVPLVACLPEQASTAAGDRTEITPAALAMPARRWSVLATGLRRELAAGSRLPTLRRRVLRHHEGLVRIRVAVSYGGHLPPATAQLLAELGIALVDLYGTVECGPVVRTARGAGARSLLPDGAVSLVDGALVLDDPVVGVVVTGDTAVLDAAGYLPGDPEAAGSRWELATRVEQLDLVAAAHVAAGPDGPTVTVALDRFRVLEWAVGEDLDRRSYAGLLREPRLADAVRTGLAALETAQGVPPAERIRVVHIAERSFGYPTGELTADGRVRPHGIAIPERASS